MSNPVAPDRLQWAIDARARSQRLLLALYQFGEDRNFGSASNEFASPLPETALFSLLVGIAFSLWRAAFLAEMPTRVWPEALRNAQTLLSRVLETNAIAFGTEHDLQGWTGGYYLNNAKLRLLEALRDQVASSRATDADVKRVDVSLLETNPHDTWKLFCAEAERLANQLGCKLPLWP
jgi:hypothetical protein